MPLLIPARTKLVVFDFDDTLVGTRKNIWELHKFIAKTFYEIDLSEAEILAHWGKPVTELARNLYKTSDTATAIARIITHTVKYPKEKLPGINVVLRRLKSKGVLVGIVSATIRPIFIGDCKHVSLPLNLIDYIQTSEDTDFHKPDERVFLPLISWASKQGIATTEILYVGDGLQDMRASQRAGINFLGVTTGLVTSEAFDSNGAKSIANLRELVG